MHNPSPIQIGVMAFVATQTEEKLRRENIKGKTKANHTHYEVGAISVGARHAVPLRSGDGNMPEDLPTPDKSVKQIEGGQKKQGDVE